MMEVHLFYFAASKAWSWNANSSENEMFLRAPELQAGNEHKQQRPLAQNAVLQNAKNKILQKFAVLTGGRARDSWRTERSIIGDHQGARQKRFEGLKVDLFLFSKGGSFAMGVRQIAMHIQQLQVLMQSTKPSEKAVTQSNNLIFHCQRTLNERLSSFWHCL